MQKKDCRAMVWDALRSFGRLDVLLTSADIGAGSTIVEAMEENWDRVLDLNLEGVRLSSEFAIPVMVDSDGGAIVHIAPINRSRGNWGRTAFGAARDAVINLTRQMAVDYGHLGIRVNALCPGRIVTEDKVEFLEARPDEVRRQKYTYLLGRPGTMRECAYAALFLASDESSFVTGHALMVDGGLTAQLQDAAATFVEQQVLAELGMSGK